MSDKNTAKSSEKHQGLFISGVEKVASCYRGGEGGR